VEEDLNRRSKETRRAITDYKKNPDNWELVSRVVKPATAKKYSTGETESKKRNQGIGVKLLSSLEHSILGTTLTGWEPVHALYKDALNEFEDVTFDSVIEALVKLFNKGYVECQILENIDKPVYKLDKKELLKHYGGDLSEDEINIYPKVAVHEFRATPKGEEEEAKDIYNVYYTADDNER
jgi:hypothetical protein